MAQWCLPSFLQQAGRVEIESAPRYGEPKGSSMHTHKAIATNRYDAMHPRYRSRLMSSSLRRYESLSTKKARRSVKLRHFHRDNEGHP
jgi:hypothetical protein